MLQLGLVWMLFSGAHGADLETLLGLNRPPPPWDPGTSLAEKSPGSYLHFFGISSAFSHRNGKGNVISLYQNIRKCFPSAWLEKVGQLVGKISFSQSCFADPLPDTLHQSDSISITWKTSPEGP